MNSIYIYDGNFERGDKGFDLIKLAALMFCVDKKLPYNMREAKIIRDDKGKPYFENIPIEFSLTHSGKLWMCMFSDKPCGLDLQIMKECDHVKIAERYYSEEEIEYVNTHGIDGFYKIWVRKEAYAKMTGDGIFGASFPSVLTGESGHYFTEIEISEGMKCAFCTPQPLADDFDIKVLG